MQTQMKASGNGKPFVFGAEFAIPINFSLTRGTRLLSLLSPSLLHTHQHTHTTASKLTHTHTHTRRYYSEYKQVHKEEYRQMERCCAFFVRCTNTAPTTVVKHVLPLSHQDTVSRVVITQ